MTRANISQELCKLCDGRVECAPTAILLIALVHALYGHLPSEPNYFRKTEENIYKDKMKQFENDGYDFTSKYKHEFDYVKNINNDREKQNQEEYDFVIVGGGTAGCVLASRLSENRKWKILLLEAGPEQPKVTFIPGLTSEFKGSSLDWQYTMRPKQGFCQNRGKNGCEIIQGRVLGGTSTINDMAYIRGSPADYDEWAFNGNEGWEYNKILKYFKYSEANYDRDISKNTFYHSMQGPLDVGRYTYVDDNIDIILSALNDIGYNYTDVNGRNQLGFMRIQTMSYFGERISTYTAFLDPIRKLRTNINIITEVLVDKILLEKENGNTIATGVVYIRNGTKIKAKASKEVILSAGAINSAKLLMQSGIGPKDYLEYLDLKVFMDLPVGSNFHDHLSVCLPVIQLTKTATTSNFYDKLQDITKYYATNTGPLAANFQVLAFIESTISDIIGTPDIEIRFKGHDSSMYYDKMDICITLLTPKSRGYVLLNSTDYLYGRPLVYPNFLKFPTDEIKILEGIKEMIKLFDSQVFKTAGFEFNPELILNNECNKEEKVTQKFWSCIIKQFSSSAHNYVGTCKMGPHRDPESVVDPQLRIHGVNNLRVADASVIPKITRGATAASVIMIAEKVSDLIKSNWY